MEIKFKWRLTIKGNKHKKKATYTIGVSKNYSDMKALKNVQQILDYEKSKAGVYNSLFRGDLRQSWMLDKIIVDGRELNIEQVQYLVDLYRNNNVRIPTRGV